MLKVEHFFDDNYAYMISAFEGKITSYIYGKVQKVGKHNRTLKKKKYLTCCKTFDEMSLKNNFYPMIR